MTKAYRNSSPISHTKLHREQNIAGKNLLKEKQKSLVFKTTH